MPGDGGAVGIVEPFPQMKRMIEELLSGGELVLAERQGALLVYKQRLGSLVTIRLGRLQPLAEDVAAGLPPARQGKDWFCHPDQANHRRPVPKFGRPLDDSQRCACRG